MSKSGRNRRIKQFALEQDTPKPRELARWIRRHLWRDKVTPTKRKTRPKVPGTYHSYKER